MQFCTHDSENLYTGNGVFALTKRFQVPVAEPVRLRKLLDAYLQNQINEDHEFTTADCSKHFGQEVLHPCKVP
jgi:hypothetical protein